MKKLVISISILTMSFASVAQKGPATFKNGDRVVFGGNSITENGFYELYIWQYYMLHFPERKIVVMNGGVGGDVAGQLLARFEGDLMRLKPTVLVITFGMNDSKYFEYWNKPEQQVRDEAVATSLKSYQGIEEKLKALPNVQKIIMTSSPFDETVTGPKNNFKGKYKTMIEIAKFQEASAKKNNWGFVDLMRPMTDVDMREQKRDTNFTLTGPDRIHPGNAGHFAMAYFFLKAQGLSSVVADITVSASKGKLVKAVNSSVSNVKSTNGNLSFDYKANSLPYPIDSQPRVWENPQKQSDALAVIPFTKDFNKENFTITGLKADQQYAMKIDGEQVGQWSGSELSKGVNLAIIHNTPQYKQAQQIADWNIQYRDLEQKIRAYYWLQFNFFTKKNMLYQDDQAAVDSVNTNANRDWAVASKKDNYQKAYKKENRDSWEKQMAELIDKIYSYNKPAVRHIEIMVVK